MSLKHVQTIHKRGQVYRYLRIPGQPRIRLPDLPPDAPEFLAAYATAMHDAPKQTRAKAGTIKAVCESYLRSDRHKLHSPGYRAIVLRHVDAIRRQADDALMRDLKTAPQSTRLESMGCVWAVNCMPQNNLRLPHFPPCNPHAVSAY